MAAADLSSDQERQWVIQIKEVLEREDLETAILSPASIFHLPDSICNHNPDVYIPKRIGLGPHHHYHFGKYQKLHSKMEIFKLNMAKKTREKLELPDFHQLIQNQLLPLDLRIRSCFDADLVIGRDALSWILLVDALFLLQLLLSKPTSKLTENNNLFKSEQDKLVAHFEIVSDVLKLENQIPCLVIEAILSTNANHNNNVKLPLLLYDFCKSVSPFAIPENVSSSRILDQSSHLLQYIYFSILIRITINYPKIHFPVGKAADHNYISSANFIQKSLSILGSILNIAFINQLSEAIGLIMEITQPVGRMLNKQSSPTPIETTSCRPVIPSASQLRKVNVKFKATHHGILDTQFDKNSATLSLPVITVNAFTETLLANLVAFEEMANIYPPACAQYLTLMKALIPTRKDFKILKDANIICTQLGSHDEVDDEQVLKLFDQVGSSIICCSQRKKLKHLHQSSEAKKGTIHEEIKRKYEKGLKGIVEEINNYYGSRARIKVKRFLGKYGIAVLKILALLIILFLLFLVLLPLVNSAKKLFKTHL